MTQQDEQLNELRNVFVQEADLSLSEAEETLMTLEQDGFQMELVNKAFRLAHNFKGSARSVGFTELGELAHKYEDVLSMIKSQELELTAELITALLTVNDALKKAITGYSKQGSVFFDPRPNIALLDRFTGTMGAMAGGSEEDLGYGTFDDEPVQERAPKAKAQGTKSGKVAASSESPAGEGGDGGKKGRNQTSNEFHRVSSDRIKSLFDVIGEVVVNQSILEDWSRRNDNVSDIARQAIGYMSKLINDLQSLSLSMRMIPIKPLFQKLRRTVRDVSDSLSKEINFVDEGDYCELDKAIADKIADPLNHMIRNAIDHGVDSKEERLARGKPPVATVRFVVQVQDDQVKIVIADDGRGLDKKKIFAKAQSIGAVKSGDHLSDEEIYALIFLPGFSTKDQVTDVSGRGVGMEVVQNVVDELKGSIKITSAEGVGTTFEITLPLSLSIIAGMVVLAGGSPYVIPVSQLVETIELNKYQVEKVNGQSRVINLRGEIMPVYDLSGILRTGGRDRGSKESVEGSNKTGLVTLSNGRKVTLEVDEIINQQKVVLKQLGHEFADIPGIIAGAVLRDGEAGLVISPDKFINN